MPKLDKRYSDHDYEMIDMFLNREKSRWSILLKEVTAKTVLTYSVAVFLLLSAIGLLWFFISLGLWLNSSKSNMPKSTTIKSEKEIIIENASIQGVKTINIQKAEVSNNYINEKKITNDKIGLVDITNNSKNADLNKTATSINECQGIAQAGDSEPKTFQMNVLESKGTLLLNYNTYNIPDNIKIVYENNLIFESGCVGTNKKELIRIPYNGKEKKFIIDVLPNCDGTTKDTKWLFELKC